MEDQVYVIFLENFVEEHQMLLDQSLGQMMTLADLLCASGDELPCCPSVRSIGNTLDRHNL